MNAIRPRCCEWLPLTTQQLRLRNLVRIEGFNIECNDASNQEVLIYYTLHSTKNDAPFYTSEALPRRHLQQKWAEIICLPMIKSNANCVCVKVWARFEQVPSLQTECKNILQENEPISALSQGLNNVCLTPSNTIPNKLLFTWGVYFSGLMLLSQQTEIKCRPNSLIFQINSHYFSSPDYFTLDNLREQLSINYQRYSTSVPKDTTTYCDEFAINSPQVSRSSSPISIVTQYDLKLMSQRYIQLYCNRNETRRSYSLQQLLQLQKVQRLHLQRQRDIVEIVAEIKQRSIRCISKEQLLCKPCTTSLSSSYSISAKPSKQHHSMGRTLSILLAEEQQIDPHSLLHAQQLQMQVESLRCRQRLLKAEHETYKKRIVYLQNHLVQLTVDREQRQNWLHTHRQKLQHEALLLKSMYQRQVVQLQAKQKLRQSVERRMSALCMELYEIYPISRDQVGFHTICGIPLPNLDAYVNNAKYAHSVSMDYVTPMALSAVLGYLAHLVQMVAYIISRPMRNPILYEGSRTRIMDLVKEIPQASREFPLYCRSSIPTKPVKYAIYLLNQNIAQLCYDITGVRCDLRATIANVLSIFNTLNEIEQNQRDNQALTRTHPHNRLTAHGNKKKGIDKTDCTLSKSHSSVDMNHAPVPPTEHIIKSVLMPSSQPISIPTERQQMQKRICRSVGSYTDSDDDFEHGLSNSDSNIMSQRDPNV